MFLNEFAAGHTPHDMTGSPEFASLQSSATDLGIPFGSGTRYRSHNLVLRHHRFHFLEWGAAEAPPVDDAAFAASVASSDDM